MKRTITKHTLIVTALMHLVGCASSAAPSKEGDILNSLTKEQKITLLAMLEDHQENQKAINAWKSHQPSLIRLSEIEDDLKTLIVQLSVLSQTRIADSTTKSSQSSSNRVSTQPALKPAPALPIAKSMKREESQVAEVREPRMGYSVQLTALDSVEKLKTYWNQIKQGYPTIVGPQVPFYEKTVGDNGKALLRLKFGEFKSYREANMACEQMRSKGGSCFVTKNTEGTSLW